MSDYLVLEVIVLVSDIKSNQIFLVQFPGLLGGVLLSVLFIFIYDNLLVEKQPPE